MEYKPGTLVHVRNRRWVVQPSNNEDILRLKPLGGTEDEITGIYKPLLSLDHTDEPKISSFPLPDKSNVGDISSARLLFDAVRLSFRNGAGPFRSFGKLSFRPRAYQLVPLIMALRQDVTRLMIADDVGIGKTIEALLVVKEKLERREIERFAVVCPPHLCNQWAAELKEKFNIDPVVIRSETAARLDRQMPPDSNPFKYFPYQVISIDYIKMAPRRIMFLDACPEMLVVDEAHTCAEPPRENGELQQRHALINEIASREQQHLLFLTATPHSGFESSFQSLLAMLNSKFLEFDISSANDKQKRELAKYFVQRRRKDVVKWLDETTQFPERRFSELEYDLGLEQEYQDLFLELLVYAQELVKNSADTQRVHYWTALGLLRGITSSPDAGISMLRNRAQKKKIEDEGFDKESARALVMDQDEKESDIEPVSVVSSDITKESESKKLRRYANRLSKLRGPQKDPKLKVILDRTEELLNQNFRPIIFCRYISTAHYVGKFIHKHLHNSFKSFKAETITSELSEELRHERVQELADYDNRVLVATDCLSEGINLQDFFTAVLHYDLPWNPNKLEQREGRVDRFGQTADVVETDIIYGKNNPIDGTVLNVLLNKAREIRKSIGVSVPFPEDSEAIMEAVMDSVLLGPKPVSKDVSQLTLSFDDGQMQKTQQQAELAFERSKQREQQTRSIFAQNALKPQNIEKDLQETDKALGNPDDVTRFVKMAVERMGAQISEIQNRKDLYTLFPKNLPTRLKTQLPDKNKINVGFKAPLPENVLYLGRNHPFVEQLSQELIYRAFEPEYDFPARLSVVRTDSVSKKTTLLQLRVRNVLQEKQRKNELIAEEMLLWGYTRNPYSKENHLSHSEVMDYLDIINPTANLEKNERDHFVDSEREVLKKEEVQQILKEFTEERTQKVIEAHARFKETIRGKGYTAVEPILPPDIMGMYILLPNIQ